MCCFRDKDGISLCSRHFDVYPEEECSKEGEATSCPTSPHLPGQAGPAPLAEETRSVRGKKCTRFMDQVSEIEVAKVAADQVRSGASVSNSCVTGNTSHTGSTGESPVVMATGICSHLSLVAAPSEEEEDEMEGGRVEGGVSVESVLSEGRGGSCTAGRRSSGGLGHAYCRIKAESTSVLLDGADSRMSELGGGGGARRKSDRAYRNDLSAAGRSFMGTNKKMNGPPKEKEHRSQPGNLCDISELKGMPTMHSAGCSDLLAVMDDTSCESVAAGDDAKTGQSRLSRATTTTSLSTYQDSHKVATGARGGRRTATSISSYSDCSLSQTSIGSDTVIGTPFALPEIEQPVSQRHVVVDCDWLSGGGEQRETTRHAKSGGVGSPVEQQVRRVSLPEHK